MSGVIQYQYGTDGLHVLVPLPDGGFCVADVEDLAFRLQTKTPEEAIEGAGLDTHPDDADTAESMALVRALNATGDQGAYWNRD